MIDTLMPLIKKFMPFAQERMGFEYPPKLFLKGDNTNAKNPLGKTAFYDPGAKSVTLYTTDRHPKDVMRSLSHELVHHTQACNGKFDDVGEMGEGYAQNDEHLREMEREAYEVGNMCFRDWEDSIKSTIYFEHLQKGEKKMSIKDWKNNEISTLLSEAWGFKFNTLHEFDEFSEGKGDYTDPGGGGKDSQPTGDPEDERKAGKDVTTGKLAETESDDDATNEGVMDAISGAGALTGNRDDDEEEVEEGLMGAVGDVLGQRDDDDDDDLSEDSGAEEGEHYKDNAMHDEDHIKAIEHHLDALKRDRDYDEEHIDERSSMEDAHPQGPGRKTTKTSGERVTSESAQVSPELRNAILEALRKHF